MSAIMWIQYFQEGIGHNREDPMTAPQWPNLNQPPPDMGNVQQYSDGQFVWRLPT